MIGRGWRSRNEWWARYAARAARISLRLRLGVAGFGVLVVIGMNHFMLSGLDRADPHKVFWWALIVSAETGTIGYQSLADHRVVALIVSAVFVATVIATTILFYGYLPLNPGIPG